MATSSHLSWVPSLVRNRFLLRLTRRPLATVWGLTLLGAGIFNPAPLEAASPAPVCERAAMVVTSQADATRAGIAMLQAGGNAVDAAVAAAFALGVTQPQSGGIGGGAFVLLRTAGGEVFALDARETAPASATRDMYLGPDVPEGASLFGPLAVATPGFVAGMALALERWGTLPLAQVLEPAIRLAAQGYAIGAYQAGLINRVREHAREQDLRARFPELARIHFPEPGPAERGFTVVQTDLATSLRAIAEDGPQVFYEGWIARAIADELAHSGGLVTLEDLAAYRPVLREPVRGTYREFEVISFPPPSSGGVALVEALNILEGFDLAGLGAGSSASIHRIAEAMKLAFADRASFLGDPDFVDVPVAALTSKSYAGDLRQRINPPRWRRAPWTWGKSEIAIRVKAPGDLPDDAGTTHLSVTDGSGMAVAITLTVNTPYGSLMVVPGTGIVLNNEMDDFAKDTNAPNVYGLVDVRGANAIVPGKRPLSSMTPTLVLRDGEPYLVTGGPGGPRIISTVLLTILNVIDYGMDIEAAVSAPRFHHQWVPDILFVEDDIPMDVREGLRERGHKVVPSDNWSAAESVRIDPISGFRCGGNDPRRDGLALGY